MKFGPVAVDDAVGAILAHSVRADGGTLKKGRTLAPADVEALKAAGMTDVTVARLDESDVHEDEAAGRIAAALAGAHVSAAEPFTGRANLNAERAGLALVEDERLRAVNRLDERLTVATLPAFDPLISRQMLATVKIIPFALPKTVLEAALELAREGGPILSVAPFVVETVDMVVTETARTKPAALEKTAAAMRERLERCGARLGGVEVCPHTEKDVAAAIASRRRPDAPLLLFGASAIVDRDDVVPAGLAAAGGEVIHLGMPVDPGNLLMFGALGETPVIGVPSCARSPKLNGFDWVLQRVLAGLDVRAEDIMDMGSGGLLKEIPSRPRPRERRAAAEPSVRTAPRVAAVVLAGGRSTRMGPENKLLKPLDGEPLVARTARQVAASRASSITVVTGHERERVERALAGIDVNLVHNPAYRDGLSTSLKAGVAALPEDVEGALIVLGDMPLVGPRVIDKLISAFDPEENRSICVPIHRGKRGNPVLWGAAYLAAFEDLDGDVGAKGLLAEFPESICGVEVDDSSVLLDLDTPESFSILRTV